jgi:uncharacterized protein YqjF (DUF2071 family)
MPRRFLTAHWRSLVMLNYPIEPAVLQPLVPKGTELDTFQQTHFVSVVGFLFLRTRVLGLPIPFHRNFEEINLRFYVRRRAADGWRRGVVFIKEVVPRALIAWVARRLYNENYVACPTASFIRLPDRAAGTPGRVEYTWTVADRPNLVAAEFQGEPKPLWPGSEEEFITEHYWGYVPQRDGSVLEYRVEHPPWRVWHATTARLDCDVRGFYGDSFSEALSHPPHSAFVAEGSAVSVFRGEGLVS